MSRHIRLEYLYIYSSSKRKTRRCLRSPSLRVKKEYVQAQAKGRSDAKSCERQGESRFPTASKPSNEKIPFPKEEDEESESPLEKKMSLSLPPEKSGDEGCGDEAQSGED